MGEIISVVEAETCVPDWLRTLALRTVAIQVTPPPSLAPTPHILSPEQPSLFGVGVYQGAE